MNTILYWFSGTGNSLWAARELARRLGDTELVSLARPGGAIRTAQRVGLVFPVYAFGPPKIVADFARDLPDDPQMYLFAVATNGGMAGGTFSILRTLREGRQAALAAGWSLKMPGNAITIYGGKSESKQQAMLAKNPAKLDAIAQAVRQQQRGRYEDSAWPLPALARGLWKGAMRQFPTGDKKFYATDACIHCGLCERICPTRDIVLVDRRPTWQGRCAQCMACIQWCPVEAIQSGKGTINRRRYHHPEIKAEDIV